MSEEQAIFGDAVSSGKHEERSEPAREWSKQTDGWGEEPLSPSQPPATRKYESGNAFPCAWGVFSRQYAQEIERETVSMKADGRY